MKVWRRALGVAIWRYGGLEVWGRDVSVGTWRHGGAEVEVGGRVVGVATWRQRVRCRIGDIEARRRQLISRDTISSQIPISVPLPTSNHLSSKSLLSLGLISFDAVPTVTCGTLFVHAKSPSTSPSTFPPSFPSAIGINRTTKHITLPSQTKRSKCT